MRVTRALAALCLAATPSGAQTWAVTDTTVIDPRSGRIAAHATVVVSGSSIAAVQAATAPVSRHARRIDGRGKYLIPGLWDAHVHLTKAGELSLPLFVANGVTAVRDMGSDFADIARWRERIASGRARGPRIFTAGPILESAANVARMKREGTVEPVERIRMGVAGPAEGRAAVARLAALGVDHVKMRTSPDDATFLAVGDEARRRGLPFAAHPIGSLRGMIGSGLTSIEHFVSFPPLDALSADERRALFADMAKEGMSYSNTMVNLDALFLSEAEAKARVEDYRGVRDPRRKYVCGYLVDDWREQAGELKGNPYEVFRQHLPGFRRDLREMRAAGVPVLAGTDVGVLLMYPGFSLHDELRALVSDAGFTPMEALRAATGAPADYFRRSASLGGVAAGQAADLVLLDADPLADIAHTRRIAGVMANGVWLDRTALDRLLADVARDAAGGCSPGGQGTSKR